MKSKLGVAVSIALAALLGCTVPSTYSNPSPPTGAWTNWQIQAGSTVTSPPTTNPNFVGALQVQGSQASAIFTVGASGNLGPQVLSFTGSFDPSTQGLSIITTGYSFTFAEPSTLYTPVAFNVLAGCVGPPSNLPVCNAIFLAPSVAVEIAPLNGTYTGTLTDTATPGMSGAGTLTLIQSSTPNSSGAFPLTGTIVFPSSSDLGTVPLAGTVSGRKA